ncbi:MAG: hypothetical protein HND54_06425 [Bacteroidetes bacterium]|nr:hypothetical protein [Bacteroidota bacterium]NOG57352.1 hypothetical protein [Bacteroidota bacterium]
MSKTIFEEKQRFNQPLVWIGLFIALSVVIYTSFFVDNERTTESQLFTLGLFLLIITLFLFIQLKTRIDDRGIHFQFFPFHFSMKTYTWDEIYSAEAIKYSPIGDYGGWGYRISFRGKGKAYSTRGDKGIKIILKDGKTRMIGTQKMEEANSCILQYIQKKN